MNRKILIALIIIVLIVLVGLVSFSQGIKVDTQIKFLSNTSLQNGDSVEFELVDAQGNKLSGQQLDIKFETSEGVQNYSIATDSQGKGSLVLSELGDGNYTITVTYAGDNDHNNCSAREIITIGDVSQTASSNSGQTSSYTSDSSAAQTTDYSSSSSQSSSDLSYDSDLNVYYDSNGVIRGGQNDGMSYDDIKNNPPQIDENGNLE